MPELPEVEIAGRNLSRWMLGHRIREAEVDATAKRIIRPASKMTVERIFTGAKVTSITRVGKQLLITLHHASGDQGAISHLGMTGKWMHLSAKTTTRWSRIRLRLDDGSVLHYVDPRMFGRLRVVPDARFKDVPEIAALGPDPIHDGIDPKRLETRFARTKLPIKVAMLDQSTLPGVGNIQASEGLFRAKIDPRRKASSLDAKEIKRLAKALLDSMHETIAREDGPDITYVEEAGAPNPFRVYGHAGKKCPRCRKETIERIVQATRATFYCSNCQR